MRRGALVAIATLLALAGCGGGEDEKPTAAAGNEVELHVPAGWTMSEDGLTVAAAAADLTRDVPQGPRVRALTSASPPSEDATIDEGPGAAVVDGPEEVTIGGRDALRITLRVIGNAERDEGVTVRRYLAAASPTGKPVLFILEAPESEFEANAARLDRIPGWTS